MPVSIANDPFAGHLKREVSAVFGSARNLGLLGLVAILAGISGPFGTYEAFSPLARFVYWLLIVFGTAAAGHATGTAVEYLLGRFAWPTIPRLLAASLLTAVPVFGVVVLALFAFGYRADSADLVTLFIQCIAVVGGVALLTRKGAPAARRSEGSTAPKLLARLPGARRGRLLRLQAQDHYVEVITTRGRTLVPMRFRDAIDEAKPEPGAQVHRSHWIALHAVSGRCRINDRTGLRMSDGSFVPIGRKFRSAVRETVLS